MSSLFLTKSMSVCTPYGILVIGCLAILVMMAVSSGAQDWRQYQYSADKSWKTKAVYWFAAGFICLTVGLFILLRKGWLMGAAFFTVLALLYHAVGGGIRSQAERE